MGRAYIKQVNPKEILLENILLFMDGRTFGKDVASLAVGGEKRLTKLIEEGKIECTKTSMRQNGKWFCNAGQVLRHCRDLRK